jgi:hypothetical protein
MSDIKNKNKQNKTNSTKRNNNNNKNKKSHSAKSKPQRKVVIKETVEHRRPRTARAARTPRTRMAGRLNYSSSSPAVNTISDRVVTLTFNDYVADIEGNTTGNLEPTVAQYFINPGNEKLFPTSFRIGACYTKYRMKSFKASFVTANYDSIGAGTSAGNFAMLVNYDPTEPIILDTAIIASYPGRESATPLVNMDFSIRTRAHGMDPFHNTSMPLNVCAGNNLKSTNSNSSPADFHVGSFQTAIQGTPTNTLQGKLYVEATFEFSGLHKPDASAMSSVTHASSTPSTDGSNPLVGFTTVSRSGGLILTPIHSVIIDGSPVTVKWISITGCSIGSTYGFQTINSNLNYAYGLVAAEMTGASLSNQFRNKTTGQSTTLATASLSLCNISIICFTALASTIYMKYPTTSATSAGATPYCDFVVFPFGSPVAETTPGPVTVNLMPIGKFKKMSVTQENDDDDSGEEIHPPNSPTKKRSSSTK